MDSEYAESKGFFNFYPKISFDGNHLAYLSNKGRDYSAVSLYLKSTNDSTYITTIESHPDHNHDGHSHTHSINTDPTIPYISTTFSFSPNGNKIVYSVNKKNKYGEDLRDLFIHDITTKKNHRITESARIQSPSWGSNGKIVAISYKAGTHNLVVFDPDSSNKMHTVTSFTNAETIFTPIWHPDGTHIYFSYADFGQRSIKKINLKTLLISDVLADDFTDYRDPFLTKDGTYLYYAANYEGRFNIYRKNLSNQEIKRLTSVVGGAFMPHVHDATLYFSEYEKDGYKIKKRIINESKLANFTIPKRLSGLVSDTQITLNDYNDKDINAFDNFAESIADTGSYKFKLNTFEGNQEITYRKHTDTFLNYSFFPVLRFDNYTKLNGSNGALLRHGKIGKLGENLLRDMKPGIYFGNREATDKLSLFGGIMLGLASKTAEDVGDFFSPSRLIKLDRDIFFMAEYRGLPFIKRSWSPTISIEVFNLHRNVKNGLKIEEFPCTSCLPDTTRVDIGYEIWEANIFLRSKLSRRSLLELGIGYSPYQVQTDNFYSKELKSLISGSMAQFFIRVF